MKRVLRVGGMLAWGVALGAKAASGAEGKDPERVAREVFQGPDFWWKRVEESKVQEAESGFWWWLWEIVKGVWKAVGWVMMKVGEFLGWLLKKLFGWLWMGGTGSAADSVVVWVVVLVVVGLLAWKFYPALARWLRREVEPRRRPGEGLELQTLAEATDLLDQAGEALREGKYPEAVRLALLAVIARLEKQGLLRYDTTRTNREYQTELRPRADLSARFGQVARIYERIWYGRGEASSTDAQEAIRLSGLMVERKELGAES